MSANMGTHTSDVLSSPDCGLELKTILMNTNMIIIHCTSKRNSNFHFSSHFPPMFQIVPFFFFASFSEEKDLPEGLDQQIITWEMLQKENYLANLETKKKESNEERLKKMSEK